MEFTEPQACQQTPSNVIIRDRHIWGFVDGHATLRDAIHRPFKKTLATLVAATWIALQPLEPYSSIFTIFVHKSHPIDNVASNVRSRISLPHINLLDFFFGLLPRVEVLLGPVNVASRVSKLHMLSVALIIRIFGISYHITLEIILFLLLKPLQIFENTGTGVLHVLLGYAKSLLKLSACQHVLILDQLSSTYMN